MRLPAMGSRIRERPSATRSGRGGKSRRIRMALK